jgi:hypothetical protein
MCLSESDDMFEFNSPINATVRSHWQVGLLAVLMLCNLTNVAWLQAQDFPPGLQWGDHAVGFRSEIVLDYSRRYTTRFDAGATYGGDDKKPRPILVNMWYPAKGSESGYTDAKMPYRRYLQLRSEKDDLKRWADGLSGYAADVMSQELFGKPVADLDDLENQLWNRFLDSPTNAIAEAEPAEGPCAVIIYHSGAGSSYDDSSLFCELLASSGFVVLGSAYPKADGSSFNIDSSDGSVRDLEFLSRYARSLPFADWRRLGFAGHSAGAQSVLRAAIRPDCPADVLVLLDTTIDYYSLAIPSFQYLTNAALENIDNLNQPMLVVAGPEAMFEMCDRFLNSDRAYLTVPELGHNEFIAQGIFRLRVLRWMVDERPDDELSKELQRSAVVNRNYVELCYAVRAYLNAQLNNQTAAFEQIKVELSQNDISEVTMCVQLARVGERGPPAYLLDSIAPPAPRQLGPLLAEVGVKRFCEILEEWRSEKPESPVYHGTMIAGSILYDLVEQNRLSDARTLNTYTQGIGVDGLSMLRFLAQMSRLTGKQEQSRHFLEVVLAIDPNDSDAQKKLQELDSDESAAKDPFR